MHYIAYTDGSFKEVKSIGQFYASAALLVCEEKGTTATFSKVADDPELLPMRNVAGELMAVMMVLEHCLNTLHVTQEDTLTIYHDYIGLANWVKRKDEPGYWRAKNYWTQAYREYVLTKFKTRCKLEFVHVPGHSGIPGNEVVDKIAKDAIEKELLRRINAENGSR